MNHASVLHRLDRLFGLPEFVKQADVEDLSFDRDPRLSANAFADAANKAYPCHTKAACYVSTARFWSREADEEADPQVAEKLASMAKFWGIEDVVRGLTEKIAADYAVNDPSNLKDEDYGLVTVVGGEKLRDYPLIDAESVKAAACRFREDRVHYPWPVRRDTARRILEKAASFEADLLPHAGYLELTESAALEPRSSVSVGIRLARRIPLIKTAEAARVNLARLVNACDDQAVSAEEFDKIAEAVDELDREHDLTKLYGVKGSIELLESARFYVDPAEKQASGKIRLTNGQLIGPEEMEKISLQHFQVLPDYLSAVETGGRLDMEKLADVLPTMPADDANLLCRTLNLGT
jgi:hypothetical protein